MMTARDPECGCKRHVVTPEGGRQISLEHQMPTTLTHHYPLPALGASSVPLYRGSFRSNNTRYRGLAEMRLQPIPRIQAQGRRVKGISVDELHSWFTDFEVIGWVDRPDLSLPVQERVPQPPPTSRVSGKLSPDARWRAPFIPAPVTVNPLAVVDEVTFFLLDGWRARDGLNTCHHGTYQPGRLQLALGTEWDLRIEPRGDVSSKQLLDHMRSTGNHTVTHVCRLRRANRADYPAGDSLQVLSMLDDLLSFAMGRVIATALPVGWKDGQPVWSYWSALRAIDVPAAATSWLDETHAAQQIENLLQVGFATRQDPLRWAVFKNALHYYLTANFNSSETVSTLLPVSGLQVLAYGHFVKTLPITDPAHVSNSAWENRAAQRILRDLMSQTTVDLAIPTWLTGLTAIHAKAITDAVANKQPAPTDPLGSIIKMRNSVAHPNQASLAKWTSYDWAEAGIYTMNLFDIAMLWWLGYDGLYKQRTDASHIGPVPWAASTPSP